MNKLRILLAAATILVSAGAAPGFAQNAHEPFLRRDTPPTAWYYDNRDDIRDFHTNGVFPGNFAANPGVAWIGAAGIFGALPSGGSHFGPIYCTRRYRSHNPMPGYFQGDDGVWYRCR
ncbi:MAG: hypothetical protein JWP25_7972 [Bradyrhizobium sp.]|jgi:hypothetical protein|nr:hypothetical protein [Bradyrhizobium sp.]